MMITMITEEDHYRRIDALLSLQIMTPDPYKYFFDPGFIVYNKKYLKKYIKDGKPNLKEMIKKHPSVIKEIEERRKFCKEFNKAPHLYSEKDIENRQPLTLEAHQYQSWFTEQNISYSYFIGAIGCEVML